MGHMETVNEKNTFEKFKHDNNCLYRTDFLKYIKSQIDFHPQIK